jgi:hypothetical protein
MDENDHACAEEEIVRESETHDKRKGCRILFYDCQLKIFLV